MRRKVQKKSRETFRHGGAYLLVQIDLTGDHRQCGAVTYVNVIACILMSPVINLCNC